MNLPFLKDKKINQGGSTVEINRSPDESSDDSLMDSIGQEFLDAIERKDIQALRSALEALVIHIQSMDQVQDKEQE